MIVKYGVSVPRPAISAKVLGRLMGRLNTYFTVTYTYTYARNPSQKYLVGQLTRLGKETMRTMGISPDRLVWLRVEEEVSLARQENTILARVYYLENET